jgi:histidyl-tRNA synthetase
MRDLLPADMSRFRRIEDVFRHICHGWGYDEVRTPTIEHLHLFTSAGTLSHQMLDRVYSFLDWDGWSGERVVVRPDSTIPVARLYNERLTGSGLTKLFYVQNVLRFADGDEQRESWQCGAELLGEGHPHGDVEAIVVTQEVLQRLGIPGKITLSDPGILRAILVKAGFDLAGQVALFDRVLDGDESALDDVEERIPGLNQSLRVLLTMEGRGTEFLSNLRGLLGDAIPELNTSIDELSAVAEVLTEIGTPYSISPVLVRNFEYYTGTVFHVDIDGQRVGGGGRYDGLASVIGGDNVRAAGFALEMDVIAPMLPEVAAENSRITIRTNDDASKDVIAAFALANALRAAGAKVDVGPGQATSPRDVVVDQGTFLITKNGSRTVVSDVKDVVRALTQVAHD